MCTKNLSLGKYKRTFNSPCSINLVETFLVVKKLITHGTKLCSIDAFVVRTTLELESDIIRNSSVVKFKVILLVEHILISDADRISAPSLLHVSALQVVSKEGEIVVGARALSECGTRESEVMIFLPKIQL